MKILILFFSGVILLAGCSPGYVMRAAYEEGKILAKRRKISAVVQDETTDPEIKRKLGLVVAAREFAISMGLNPKESFTRYTKLDRDVLTWVVVGSKPDAFELATWWFPIVGRVPYKGFWEREDAENAAKDLSAEGYETWVRGSDAMSTLGWFNDPILSTTLNRSDFDLVNTVIHEITHSTVWVPDHVDFNESLANFVGHRGAVQYFKESPEAQAELQFEFELAQIIEGLYQELSALYSSQSSREEKLKKRSEIFHKWIDPLRAKKPNMKAFAEINNAEIIQLKLYLTGLSRFENLFLQSDRNWLTFIAAIEKIRDQVDDGDLKDPFVALP